MLFAPCWFTERDFNQRRRERLPASFMFDRQRDRGYCQLLRAQPAAELHDQTMRGKQCTVRVFEPVGQFDMRGKSGRRLEPVEQLRRSTEGAIQRIQQMLAAAALQTGARQTAYVSD